MQRALYALVGVFVLIVAGGLALPRFARVEVSVVVDSPPAVIFAQANDFRRLALWAPPEADDPDARVSYDGPARGEGARVEWNGPVSGGGTQVIVESIPYEYVSYLVNPGESAAAASWIDIAPSAGGTRVTRGFEHDYGYNLVGRYFGLLWAGMIRRDYRVSLDRLQALLDGLPTVDFSDLDFDESYVEATNIAYLVTTVPRDAVSDASTFERARDELQGYLDDAGLEPAGPAIAIRRGAIGARRRLDIAIALTGTPPSGEGPSGVTFGRSYAGYAVRATHPGSRLTLAATHEKLSAYLAATGRRPNGDPWESYETGSDQGGPRIDVYYPVLAD